MKNCEKFQKGEKWEEGPASSPQQLAPSCCSQAPISPKPSDQEAISTCVCYHCLFKGKKMTLQEAAANTVSFHCHQFASPALPSPHPAALPSCWSMGQQTAATSPILVQLALCCPPNDLQCWTLKLPPRVACNPVQVLPSAPHQLCTQLELLLSLSLAVDVKM